MNVEPTQFRQHMKYGIMIILLVGGWGVKMILNRNTQSSALRPLDVAEPASITSLKLLDTGEGLKLLTSTIESGGTGALRYQTVIWAGPVTEPDRRAKLFAVRHLLPGSLSWDVAVNADLSYSVVYDLAGGALYALVLETTAGEKISFSREYPLQSFSSPRFVRGSADGHLRVVSVVDETSLVLFRGGGGSPPSAYTRLGECYDGLLVAAPDGWLVICKTLTAGPSSGNVPPGTISVQRVDTELHPVGAAAKPLGATTVYQFDAAVASARLAIFAVSERGPVLALGSVGGGPYEARLVQEGGEPQELSSPSIAATESGLQLAAIAHAGTERARVLFGAAPVDARK